MFRAALMSGLPFAVVLLAYSPGGITEACCTALALGRGLHSFTL